MKDEQKALCDAASRNFGLVVDSLFETGESFSSDVIRFRSGSKQYVLKRPFTQAKAISEYRWLERLSCHPSVPKALGLSLEKQVGYVLMSVIPGMPLKTFDTLSSGCLVRLGQDMRLMHSVPAPDFEGEGSWRELLRKNIQRYIATINGPDLGVAQRACEQFLHQIHTIPDANSAVATQFDLRTGNVMAENGIYQGLIDFESMRGGHPSMDFFKLLTGPAVLSLSQLECLLDGYGPAGWYSDAKAIVDLVSLYQVYHGLAGLAWCSKRGIGTENAFYRQNLAYLKTKKAP